MLPHYLSAFLLIGTTTLLGVTAHGRRLVFDLGVGVRPVSESAQQGLRPGAGTRSGCARRATDVETPAAVEPR